MQYSVFAIDDAPYCVWEWDLQKRNLEFIEHIDHKYFRYLADTHLANIDGHDKQRAAIALRTAYHHGLETLFTFLCATLQAPDCVVGWVQQCKTEQLRGLIRKINNGNINIFNKLGLDDISWDNISDRINLFSYSDKKRLRETNQLFSNLWHKFAYDFLDDRNIKEYNSIKHGFRTHLGGFNISIGFEKEYCMPVTREEMVRIGGSTFGTSFFTKEKVFKSLPIDGKRHFRVRRISLNWNQKSMAHSLYLISTSLNNIISFLKITNGIDPKTVKFTRPKDDRMFDEPWNYPVAVISINMDREIHEEDIKCFTKDELIDHLKFIIKH